MYILYHIDILGNPILLLISIVMNRTKCDYMFKSGKLIDNAINWNKEAVIFILVSI